MRGALALIAAVFGTAALAQGQVLTLEQALKTAQERQPQLKRAAAATEAADARKDQARASLLPQVRVAVGYGRGTNNSSITGVPPSGASSDQWNGSILANQLVYDFGQTWNRWTAAGSSAAAVAESERGSKVTVAFNVRSAFFAAQANKALVAVADENLANQERHLKQIQGFVQVGSRPEIDLAQARTDVANARVQRVDADNGYSLARAQLNQSMGVIGSLSYDVAEGAAPAVDGEDATTDALFDLAEKARPEIAAADDQVRAQELLAAAVAGGYWPSFSLSAGFTEGGRLLPTLAWNWSAGANMAWPIFEGLRTTAEVRESRALVASARAVADEVRQTVRLDVEQARLAVSASKAALSAAADAVVSAQERLRLAEGRYQAGVGNAIELGDSQLALTSARAQQVQADYRLAGARAQLLRALGRQ